MVDQTRINNGKVESPNAEIDLATLLTADISELTGSISDQPITQIDGGGLEHDGNGRLQVDSSYFDGSISGLSNPLSADLDAADYNISNAGSIESQSLSTDKATINEGIVRGRRGERIDAAKFDGTDADARLDNALSAASNGDTIYLENASYPSRTVQKRVKFEGTHGIFEGTSLSGDWTLSAGNIILQNISTAFGAGVTINNQRGMILDSVINDGTITVKANRCLLSGLYRGSATFESGTSEGLVDSCVGFNVTDNGSNTVGDIA